MYLVVVFHKAHHIVFLGLFQKAFGGGVIKFQRLFAVQLDPGHFFILKVQRAFGIGNGAAADHQNFPAGIAGDLLVGKIDHIGRVLQHIGEHSHIVGVFRQGVGQDQVKRSGIDQRLVTHDLQIQVGIHLGGHFINAAGGGVVVSTGHHIFHAVLLAHIRNALVVGCNKAIGQLGALYGLAVNPPDHGLAQNIRQGLAGHTGALITGRDHTDEFHK